MYAIVDIETTGGRFDIDRITEIAIIRFDGEKIVEQYETLLYPERSIPYNITQLTGITDAMVANAPKFYEIAREIIRLTDEAIFVAHNVRFDFQFIRHEFQRLGYSFQRKQLCTVRLSRKAFPGLPSYSLGPLAAHLRIHNKSRHRAMGDALATCQVLQAVFAKEGNADTVQDLVNKGVKTSRLPPNITMEALHQLPEACGVYFFHNAKGEVIYVGKSVNIQKRIMQHFANTTEKANRMHQQVHAYSFELTGSELVAKLYESHLIKTMRPIYNAAQRHRLYPYCLHTYTDAHGYLNIGVAKSSDKLNIIAEYPKEASAIGHLKQLLLTYQLCERYCEMDKHTGRCFRRHLNQCHGACNFEELHATYNLRAQQAIDKAATVLEGSFALIEEGRGASEIAVIWVENGQYKGFGYAETAWINGNMASLRHVIQPYEHNPEVAKIISTHAAGLPRSKVIPFAGAN